MRPCCLEELRSDLPQGHHQHHVFERLLSRTWSLYTRALPSATARLKQLHWIPVEWRIRFKLATKQQYLLNMSNFGPLTAEIGSGVWGTRANFNGFRVLAALLQGTLVVGVSQTLQR